MSLVRRAAGPLQAAGWPWQAGGGSRPGRAARVAPWLILGGYLLGAVALAWHLWADPAGRAQVVPANGISHDVDLFAWFLRYEATAIAHGRLPDLVTTAVNAPQGINLMWNTSFLLPGVVFAPLTLLIGPQATLTTLLTLGFAGSAAAMFWVLRRWGASLPAAGLGGAIFGFSPAMRIAAVGHYHLQFAVLLPLIIDALLRLVTGRGRPVRTGIWLGLLTAAQLFIAEEAVALTVCAGLVIVVVLAAARPHDVAGRVRGALAGLATAAGVLLVTAGYPLWVQFHGPLAEHGSPWSLGHFRNRPGDFVNGPSGFLLHSQATVQYLDQHAVRMVEYFAYLGWPMLVVLLVAAVRFWRDLRVRALAVTFAALEAFSLGSRTVVAGGLHYPAALLPWHYLQALPLLNQSLPNRFSLLADGAAAVVLAFSLDLAWGRARESAVGRESAPAGDTQDAGPAAGALQAPAWRKTAALVLLALAIVPIIPLPMPAAAITPTPAGWEQAFSRLHLASGARVLVVPVLPATVMRWQADSAVPFSVISGYCIAPNPVTGRAEICHSGRNRTASYLNDLWLGEQGAAAPSTARLRSTLAYWRPAAVVAVTSRGSRLGRYLSNILGPPTVQDGSVLAWRPVRAPRAIAGGLGTAPNG
ncbi:MAG TPA: hypothetical protein VF933_09085 [Streptosporangiaceae bacterium]